MLHILLSDVGVLQPQQRASYPVWCIFSPHAREYRLIYLQRDGSGVSLVSGFIQVKRLSWHPQSQCCSALTWKKHSVSLLGGGKRKKKALQELQHHYWQQLFLLLKCWQPFLSWQPASNQHMNSSAPLWSLFILHFCKASIWVSHWKPVNSFKYHIFLQIICLDIIIMHLRNEIIAI